MKLFEDHHSHLPPALKPGNYIVSLHRPAQWYIKYVCGKGKTPTTTNVHAILPLMISKIFGVEINQEEIDLSLNLDCMVNGEAAQIQENLEFMILAEILGQFPKIGAQLPDDLYRIEGMNLVITVPHQYELQRGNFF